MKLIEMLLLALLSLGQTVIISGHVLDKDGKGVEGVMVVARQWSI